MDGGPSCAPARRAVRCGFSSSFWWSSLAPAGNTGAPLCGRAARLSRLLLAETRPKWVSPPLCLVRRPLSWGIGKGLFLGYLERLSLRSAIRDTHLRPFPAPLCNFCWVGPCSRSILLAHPFLLLPQLHSPGHKLVLLLLFQQPLQLLQVFHLWGG